jgi:hypothetical protein
MVKPYAWLCELEKRRQWWLWIDSTVSDCGEAYDCLTIPILLHGYEAGQVVFGNLPKVLRYGLWPSISPSPWGRTAVEPFDPRLVGRLIWSNDDCRGRP